MSSESHDLGPVPTLTLLAGYGDSYVVPGDEVYVVAEDCDYIYQNTGSNPVADGFNIIKAIFLAGVWQRRDGGAGASGLRFNTVAVGALGSGRLIDADIVGLVDGTSTAWVESVKDTWRWDATSALTADNITVCNPTANGANPGRFIRELIPAPEWMQNATWIIDAANSTVLANDENDGTTAATPLLTDTERQRRMGESPVWVLGAYHLRYISDVPATQSVNVHNRTSPGSQIFLHGSMTDGEGQIVLFGPAIMGPITALNYAAAAGGQPWEMECATIPVSWTTAGPAGSSLIDKRGRVTAGTAANIGGKFFPIKDLGGAAPNAKARLAEPNKVGTYTAPFSTTNPTATFTPTAGDTFVIEKMTVIPTLSIDLTGGVSAGVVNGVILDSLECGTGGRVTLAGSRTIIKDGCILSTMTTLQPPAMIHLGCQFAVGGTLTASSWSITNGYAKAAQFLTLLNSGGGSITRFMCQGNAHLRFSCPRGALAGATAGWTINQLGAWDNGASYPIQVADKTFLAATATLWGNGNNGATLAAVLLYRGAQLIYAANSTALPASYFFMLTATAGPETGAFVVCFGNANITRPSVAAYDDTTQLATAKRLLSAANLSATVAAGGFGGYFFDPVTNCSMGQG